MLGKYFHYSDVFVLLISFNFMYNKKLCDLFLCYTCIVECKMEKIFLAKNALSTRHQSHNN